VGIARAPGPTVPRCARSPSRPSSPLCPCPVPGRARDPSIHRPPAGRRLARSCVHPCDRSVVLYVTRVRARDIRSKATAGRPAGAPEYVCRGTRARVPFVRVRTPIRTSTSLSFSSMCLDALCRRPGQQRGEAHLDVWERIDRAADLTGARRAGVTGSVFARQKPDRGLARFSWACMVRYGGTQA